METSAETASELGESNLENVNGIFDGPPAEQSEIDNEITENELSSDDINVEMNGSVINDSNSLEDESFSDHQTNSNDAIENNEENVNTVDDSVNLSPVNNSDPADSPTLNNSDAADISKEDSDDLNDSSPLEISDAGTDNSALSVFPDQVEQPENTTEESVAKDSLPLPQCRTKRSYVCGYCNMKTQNPREYLYHLKDAHGEAMRIFECDRCLYASKSLQKINRHNHMVHKLPKAPIVAPVRRSPKPKEEKEKTPIVKKQAVITPMSRSPRESKSPRRYEEYEFTEDLDLDLEISVKPVLKGFSCPECHFTTKLSKLLLKHEAKCHPKKKFLKCTKCSYSTHLKNRFTKHLKYHKLEVVKCDYCDFKTPYRWNLDRHMKNHNREGGLLQCHLCNFKAQIKQSLTVHIANHHVSISKENEKLDSEMTEDITEEEMEMLRMERDEDPDALEVVSTSPSFTVSNFDVDNDESREPSDHSNDECLDETLEPACKKPKIKMTFKKMKTIKDKTLQGSNERQSYHKDFVHPNDVVHRQGNLYLKTEKCKHCSFKAPFQIEVIRHMKKVHTSLFKAEMRRNKKLAAKKQCNKIKIKNEVPDSEYDDITSFTKETDQYSGDDQSIEQNDGSDTSSKDFKKKPSFFEKLQEKLTMNNVENLVCQFCGHESKCLSESVRHQKLHLSAKNIYASASLSTRCQFCRHRCKTTDDLVNHLKSCNEARKNQLMENEKEKKLTAEKKNESSSNVIDDTHPMENRVFVWNSLASSTDPDKPKIKSDMDDRSLLGGESTPSEASFSQDGSECNTDADQDPSRRKRKVNQIYKCPNCTFSSGTASRFHVHIVGHLNKKPYSCSECGYCSNWRWDITKHIKVKLSRKDNHKDAIVLVSDIIEERNYEKYDKFLCPNDRKSKANGGLTEIKKKRSKRVLEDDDTDSSKSSPCPTPINNSSASKLPAPPKLTRAPNLKSVGSAPRKRTIEPIIAGSRMASEIEKSSNEADAEIADKKFSMKPPPLVAMGPLAQLHEQNGLNRSDTKKKVDDTDESSTNYQIITDQGALNTSLETLQLLASGTTNLSFLKNLQSLSGEGESSDADALSNQMRMLLWLNCLSREAEKKDGVENNSEQNNSDIMQLVLDHEGNPEWKCSSCDFRDSEKETVVQHVSLAHSKKGPVSLLHAVHRCNVCGFAAGTKRHVLLHIESSHGGQGGIISRSEGQNVEQDKTEEQSRTFTCRTCPFTCKKQSELKKHTSHHSEKSDCVFKCVLCPFYVATKNELFEHFSVHNNVNPPKDNNSTFTSPEIKVKAQEENTPREFVCDLCPFETRSRAKLVHHRQFHRPRGLPFSCPKCSYNVTRQHLLTQHLRTHGIISTEDSEIVPHANGHCKTPAHITSGSKSPSPSLTITPISSTNNEFKKSTIDPSCLPTLSDELTKNLHDIPLVWVSRDCRYFKMFKCRQCPHVNLRKTNIQEHEKMHRSDTLPPGVGHNCQFCSYICINAGVMTSHLKVHSGALGKCHAIVDQALPNEDQLYMLAGSSANHSNNEIKKSDEKILYYCQFCPGRFFFEKEITIHSRFHSTTSNFSNKCDKCNFKVREPQQLISHTKVHTPQYQERTRTLMTMHRSASSHPPVPGNSVSLATFNEISIESNLNGVSKESKIRPNGFVQLQHANNIPQPPPTSRFKCDKCPSTFSKMITLQYHQSLHSASNPFKCSKCTYAAKTQLQLDQHTLLHDKEEQEGNNANVISHPVESAPKSNSIQETLGMLRKKSSSSLSDSFDQPPIKLKLLKGEASGGHTKKQFKYYVEEQVPLSGVELLKRKNQIEREMPKDSFKVPKLDIKSFKNKAARPEDRLGNPNFNYPLHIDRTCGKTKEKRYKCSVCPSAFEKLDQFNVHLNLHGSQYKYKCKICDYSVKFYANFMMHIKRHKYHEKMDAQSKGIKDPADDDPRFQPYIGEKHLQREEVPKVDKSSNKENQFGFDHCTDMTTAEKQHIILQQKKGDIFKTKEEEVDRKVFYCQHCPYANTRRDGVDSHSLRHEENNGRGVYMCHFCDYTAAQPNFIREHTKVHFRPFKYVQPAGFMRHDKLEIFSICSSDMSENSGSNKRLIISHEDGTFQPPIKIIKLDSDQSETEKVHIDDCFVDNGICVDLRSGDIFDAPAHMK